MSSNTNNALTKEQLFACLKDDGIELPVETINKAKSNDGEALRIIGCEYDEKLEDYSKAMAWYQMAANQNHSGGYNNIGCLYFEGRGVPQDYLTAMDYYIRAARANSKFAISNIAFVFLNENGLSANKYKALEWFLKSGDEPEEVKKLNQEGVCLTEEDRGKTISQLINETYDIIREMRIKLKEENNKLKKRESKTTKEIQELKKLKSSNEEEMKNLRKELQALRIESQQNQLQILDLKNEKESLKQTNQQKTLELEQEKGLFKQSGADFEQQLQEKEEFIKLLKITTDTLQNLVQSKTNENDFLKKDVQRLNCIIQKYQQLIQGSLALRDIVDYDTTSTDDNGKNKTDVTKTNQDEEN